MFAVNLDMDQCHKLIMEAYCQPGGVAVAKALVAGSRNVQPPPPGDTPNWCFFGKCRDMGNFGCHNDPVSLQLTRFLH